MLKTLLQGGRRSLSQVSQAVGTSESFQVVSRVVASEWLGLRKKVWGSYVVPDGEKVAVWKWSGQLETVTGPKRLFLLGSAVQSLPRIIASPNEFLRVTLNTGETKHIVGPTSMWLDPLLHSEVTTSQGITLNAHDAMVYYTETGGQATRRVVMGPALFFPAENQWVHRFVWTGKDHSAPASLNRKRPSSLIFTALRLVPDQMYFDVEEARTSDDAVVTIRLMIFFQLTNLDKMLDNTHDPPSEIINSVSADLIDFVSSRSFEEFKDQSEQLNTLDAYPQLRTRSESIGYQISKVVFRGFVTSPALQKMHDESIERRTRLKLQQETERVEQELADFTLQKNTDRAIQEREAARLTQEHSIQLAEVALQGRLKNEATSFEQNLKHSRLEEETKRQAIISKQTDELKYYESLSRLGVDLNQYFTASLQKISKLIKVESPSTTSSPSTSSSPRVHFHDHND